MHTFILGYPKDKNKTFYLEAGSILSFLLFFWSNSFLFFSFMSYDTPIKTMIYMQEKYEKAMASLAETQKKVVIAESMLEATLQYESGQSKALTSPGYMRILST
jgi:hypothetical protein